MAHKTLVGGTAYEISGGKTLIGGTAYSIKNGKTLVNGTAYDVSFGVTVVITTEQNMFLNNASVTLNGKTYSTENGDIVVAKNSIITCSVTGTQSMGASDNGTGRIIINGVEVVTAYGCTKTYEYVVKSDVTIHLNTKSNMLTESAGIITITEQ